jgi:hypothetical protein
LQVAPIRFAFRAIDTVRIPPGKAGNVFRGAFGTVLRELACVPDCPGAVACNRAAYCAYAVLFEPRRANGPSGFSNLPRPFVIRAAALDGRTIAAGETFFADLHLFGDPIPDAVGWIRRAFEAFVRSGIGAGRGRAELTCVERGPAVTLEIEARLSASRRFAIEFLTPTDLKSDGNAHADPDFHTVFARARDRVAALMAMYGTGAPEADYRALGDAARSVVLVASDLRKIQAERRSTRTGQTHSIGGLVGRAEYAGDPGPFLPWLGAAFWTGIGRHTAWGNGVIRVTEYP